ncbi:Rv3235 family protein [Streptomyces sp. Wb2n-11]|uniref:Rv3235 family protein n=1 Tax=Streptomyces sp. Wb2n-11 TaxID=1030533 RepID=UPI000A5DF9E0|nr:Rv3235 family protein [Streptomyces sp. Wb2n-11]
MNKDRTRPHGRHDQRGPGASALRARAPRTAAGSPTAGAPHTASTTTSTTPAAQALRHHHRRPTPHEQFAERLLAVLSGRRPVHWMLGHTIGEAYEQLVQLAPTTPLRTRGTLPVVRTCGGFHPRPGVVEAFASIAAGEQVRAMAFRLEQGRDLRWRCAAVELGGTPATAACAPA